MNFLKKLIAAALLILSPLTAQAGGFEGGGGLFDGAVWLAFSLAIFCFVPLATSQGAYNYGTFSVWQLPIILVAMVAGFILLRFWHGGKRLFGMPFLYIVPVVLTNIWAINHRVNHSESFPISKIISEIDWRTPPAAHDLITKTGNPIFQADVHINDSELPKELRDNLAQHGVSEALVLVFIETGAETTVSNYVLFSKTTGTYLSRVTYNDWHQRSMPERWPNRSSGALIKKIPPNLTQPSGHPVQR